MKSAVRRRTQEPYYRSRELAVQHSMR